MGRIGGEKAYLSDLARPHGIRGHTHLVGDGGALDWCGHGLAGGKGSSSVVAVGDKDLRAALVDEGELSCGAGLDRSLDFSSRNGDGLSDGLSCRDRCSGDKGCQSGGANSDGLEELHFCLVELFELLFSFDESRKKFLVGYRKLFSVKIQNINCSLVKECVVRRRWC